MRYVIILLCAILACCEQLPKDYFDGRYDGVLNQNKCNPNSFITAQVYNQKFELAVDEYRIHGDVSLNQTLEGNDPVHNATFKGHIAGPFFGKLFSGTIYDGKCNPYVELVPENAFQNREFH